jgi:hypothetical protein
MMTYSVIHLETKKGCHPKKRVRTVAKSEIQSCGVGVGVQLASSERINCFLDPSSVSSRRVGRLKAEQGNLGGDLGFCSHVTPVNRHRSDIGLHTLSIEIITQKDNREVHLHELHVLKFESLSERLDKKIWEILLE